MLSDLMVTCPPQHVPTTTRAHTLPSLPPRHSLSRAHPRDSNSLDLCTATKHMFPLVIGLIELRQQAAGMHLDVGGSWVRDEPKTCFGHVLVTCFTVRSYPRPSRDVTKPGHVSVSTHLSHPKPFNRLSGDSAEFRQSVSTSRKRSHVMSGRL